MTLLRPGIRRLLRLDRFGRDAVARELHDEMSLHVALRAEQLQAEGMSPADAEREARRLFAADAATIAALQEAALDRTRHLRMRERWESVWQDVRYAARRLGREPLITAFILATLALGIGVNVASFSVVDRVLLQGPQHVRDPEQLVRFYSRTARAGTPTTMPWLPYPVFVALRDQMRSVDGAAAYRMDDLMVGSGVASERRRVSRASSNLFPLLGVRPIRGRFYGTTEDADNVAVVGERFWLTALEGDPDIVGRSIAIEGVPHVVVGVAPAGFTGPQLRRVDVWTPIKIAERNSMNMEIVARLKPGIAADDAGREIPQHRPAIEAALPRFAQWLRGAEYLAAPISHDETARESFEAVMARWLAAIAGIILVASCANVGNLLLARLVRRGRELAVRIALGSGRARVMRLVGLEGLVLAVGAAVLALAVVVVVEPIVRDALFPGGSWAFSLVNARVLFAVATITLLTGALVGIVPALQAGRGAVGDVLRGGRHAGESRASLRAGLTVVQASLSVVLLVGAGLFLRSLARVQSVDLGMEPDRVLTVELGYPRIEGIPGEPFAQWVERSNRIQRTRHAALVDALRQVPGVERAAVTIGISFYGSFTVGLWVPGRDSIPARPGGGPYVTAAGDDYFATMGTRIHLGRAFDSNDREGSEPVVIVNQTMAGALWPGENAIGKCVVVSARENPCARVVGVAANRHRTGLKEEPAMEYYVPIGQERGFSGSTLIVRPQGDVSPAWRAIREALTNADPAIQSIEVRRLSQGLDGEMRPLRLGLVAFGLSAALALVVAGLGLYSIMAHAVAWRRQEIGVRLALGARPRSVASLVVRRGAILATIGIGVGLVVALAARRWVEPLLFETSATDPLVIGAVVAILEALALVAGWLPASRAAAVSPAEALRSD